jgi:hypothetical protein
MIRSEQETILGVIVMVRQTDTTLEPLPLRVRYDNGDGGDTPCPYCDPYFTQVKTEGSTRVYVFHRGSHPRPTTETWTSPVGQGSPDNPRSDRVSGQGFQEQYRLGEVLGQGVPET